MWCIFRGKLIGKLFYALTVRWCQTAGHHYPTAPFKTPLNPFLYVRISGVDVVQFKFRIQFKDSFDQICFTVTWRAITVNCPPYWFKVILTHWDAEFSNSGLLVLLRGRTNDAVSWQHAAVRVRPRWEDADDLWSISGAFQNKGMYWMLVSFMCFSVCQCHL